MANEITSTHEMAEADWDSQTEPSDVETDMVATDDAEGKGVEFHVSMRDYTMRDMEALIIEAAATKIIGRRNDHEIAKAIEAKCIEQITAKADKALSTVTAEIIDQPIVPKYPFMKADENPMTMRELIGLTGRAYLMECVDSTGKPTTDRYRTTTRMQHLVDRLMERAFEAEIKKATSAVIVAIQGEIRQRHEALLAAEKARLSEALAKLTA